LPDENPEGQLPEYASFFEPESVTSHLPASFNILYAGHLYDLKGTPQLLEAFGAIATRFLHTRLILMGEFLPPYSEQECRRRCRELGIEDRVEITGVLHGRKKVAQFQAAHLFVFPSLAPYESFGLVMVEAMMWGLPIVATDWRGNRDVAGPDAIYCAVDSDTLPALAGKIGDALAAIPDLPVKAAQMRSRFQKQFRLDSPVQDYSSFVHATL
jgi:glycosyltransferase involved in cell wall biosynthesis